MVQLMRWRLLMIHYEVSPRDSIPRVYVRLLGVYWLSCVLLFKSL